MDSKCIEKQGNMASYRKAGVKSFFEIPACGRQVRNQRTKISFSELSLVSRLRIRTVLDHFLIR
jgi:hypothetical protein